VRVNVHDFEDKTLGKGVPLRRLRNRRQRRFRQPATFHPEWNYAIKHRHR
jgi:hypothetical protein